MQGQWIGKVEGEFPGSLRLELEDRGDVFFGHAYLFYDYSCELPGFVFELKVPKEPPYRTETKTFYLYPGGGEMSANDRERAESKLTERFGELPIPANINVDFVPSNECLTVNWSETNGNSGSIELHQSSIEAQSELVSRVDLSTWDQFREWAIDQKLRDYVFRGQSKPNKLASTFHRTWRKDLKTWIANDVRLLFGALVERVKYPLQLGNADHNPALWSIMQHHGYPTPMLDWTYSPFVAAYFAFQNVEVDQEDSPRIFILDQGAWNERYGQLRFYVDDAPPQLVVLESMSIGNPRLGPQQALSTVTNVADVEAFIRSKEDLDGKTYLTICDLPASDRPRIMRELELMGITYGSLFPGLDGICRDMKDRLFAPIHHSSK